MIFCCHVMHPIQMRLQDFREESPTYKRNPAGKSAAEKVLSFIRTDSESNVPISDYAA